MSSDSVSDSWLRAALLEGLTHEEVTVLSRYVAATGDTEPAAHAEPAGHPAHSVAPALAA